jgi:phage FluMu gp28-like protein
MTATKTRSAGTWQRPWMYAKQERAIFNDSRYAVIEASTKTGKTVGCMVWIAERAMQGRAGRNYWWVAPIYAQAKIAYRRVKRALPREIYRANESELTITLANGAVIWFKGSENPDSLYGEDVYAAVIDEATRVKEESFHAVRSTLTATRGPLRIIGNVKGRKNWAYRMARRAESGEPDMHYAKLTAYDAVEAGVLDAREVEDAKRQLPPHVFQELYLAEAGDDEGNPFGITAIRNCIAPLADTTPHTAGIDLAKSVDWTVYLALDRQGHTCRFARWQQTPWEQTIAQLTRINGRTKALVDSTGVGDPILEALQRATPNTYQGFTFSAPSKQKLMEGLAVAIQGREVTFPDGPIVQELEVFEYVYTRTGVRYSAPDGLHDDTVMALGLAVWQRQHYRDNRLVSF